MHPKFPEVKFETHGYFQSLTLGWLFGWLVVFYGISTLVGYLKPNPVSTYRLSIYDL